MKAAPVRGGLVALCLALSVSAALGHGDVQPQPVDTAGLPLSARRGGKRTPIAATPRPSPSAIPASTRTVPACHGLQVISGGLAPDLRYLPVGKEGDEYFVERVRHGAIINGMTKMPAFEGVLSQEALWAIRTYIESKHEE